VVTISDRTNERTDGTAEQSENITHSPTLSGGERIKTAAVLCHAERRSISAKHSLYTVGRT